MGKRGSCHGPPPSLLPPESRDLRVLDLTRQVQILLRFDSRTQSIWDLIFKSRSLWKVISNQKVLPKSHKFQPFNRIATHWCALGWSLRSQPLKILNIFPKTPKPDSIDVQVNTSPLSPNSLTHLFLLSTPSGGLHLSLEGLPQLLACPLQPSEWALLICGACPWDIYAWELDSNLDLDLDLSVSNSNIGFVSDSDLIKNVGLDQLTTQLLPWGIPHFIWSPTCFLLGQKSGTILPVSYFSC